jgi:hypothetical protein
MRNASAVTQAALPWSDRSVDALEPNQRRDIAGYWLQRAQAELKVARAFIELSAGLTETGVVPEVTELLRVSIQNEGEHSELCWRLACRYADADLPQPVMPDGIEFPRLPSAPANLRPTLHAIGLCCVNESIATVWLEHCLAHASAPLARAATRLHLGDEVLHARAGWAHLASSALSRARRRDISRWILPMLRANVNQWLDREAVGITVEAPAHGLPPWSDHENVVLGVVRGVILPGFAHVGLDAAEATRWIEQQWSDARSPR